jgi:diguanylate cyclase (GGDEF)-like protein/PAS domain S-box-containing protein
MKPNEPIVSPDAGGEISALIQVLHRTEQRLEELTGGEVDTVADQGGRTLLLRRAQEQLRHSEAAKRAAILNALPAHIALLDAQGSVLAVNQAWRQFAGANALRGPEHGIGVDYLEVCERARGDDTAEAQQAAAGIRAVLDGSTMHFSMEYPCHSPTQQRWFLMTVTPLTAGPQANGAVVMHLNITERKTAEEALRNNEARFRTLSAMSSDFYWESDAEHRLTTRGSADKKLSAVTAFRRGAQIGERRWEIPYLSPDEAGWQAHRAVLDAHLPFRDFELSRRGADGAERHISISGDPVFDASGAFLGYRGIGKDITERKQAEHALQTSEERFRTMFVQAPIGIAFIDSLAGRIHEANPRFAEIAGRSMAEMANIDWLQITHPDDVQADLDNMALLNAGKINGFRMEKRYRHPDGTAVWVDMTITPFKIGDQAHPRHLCMIQDITERKAAEARIAHLNRVYAVLSGINMLIVRARGRDELFREACRIAVEAGGFRMALIAIVDRSATTIVPVASAGKDEALLNMIKDILSSAEEAPNTMVARALREKTAIVSNNSQTDPLLVFGRQYAESGVRSMAILPLLVADAAVGVLALYADEIEFFHEEELALLAELAGDIAFAIDHIDNQERLDYLAYYDDLTGLANRRLFLERVAQYLRSAASDGHKLAVFLMDLERFKNINDSLGRPAGDALLRQAAEWLTLYAGDANLLARIDADHFALVLPQVRKDGDVTRLLEKTMAAFLEHPFRLNDAVFRISATVGVAVFPDDGADAETLFGNAEAALKKAKVAGERYLFYTQKMTEAVAGKLTLENQLRQALDNEEFVLHYQPKVNLASGKLTSAEALIRWNDPRTGLVPPGRFIPILEETGLIYEVGRWALRQAVADYLRWRAAGLPAVRIAVNVSPLQLRNRGFIDEIRQVIGIDARAAAGLELEITESLIMEDVKGTIGSLQAIRALGVTVAVDDFGTGFSSLSYLAKLPVDTLKIDRSFIIEMTAAQAGLALVSTIITLAHSLKLKVVAEGVETEEQSRLLRLLACDEMQGFLFSKPVPAEIFETRFLAVPALKT